MNLFIQLKKKRDLFFNFIGYNFYSMSDWLNFANIKYCDCTYNNIIIGMLLFIDIRT